MRTQKWYGLVLVLLACLAAVSCGKKEAAIAEESGPAETTAATAAPVDLAGGATITGKITFQGPKPRLAMLRMDSEPACAQVHSGPVYSQEVVVHDNGALQYVLVYVKEGLGDKRFQPIQTKVLLDQKGCVYEPHVLGVVAGQEFEITNSDPSTHNIHPMPQVNREWNQSMSPKQENLKKSFSQPEIVPVKCNIHPWMKSHVGVFKHPFFAVSGKDGGFEIKGLPPGEYTLEAWHEKLGSQEQKVTVAPKESKTVEFTFKG